MIPFAISCTLRQRNFNVLRDPSAVCLLKIAAAHDPTGYGMVGLRKRHGSHALDKAQRQRAPLGVADVRDRESQRWHQIRP